MESQIKSDNEEITYVDDDTESVVKLLRLRIPPLVIGLLLGLVISFVTSNFEKVLSHDVRVAFFIPFIVYLADAIGTQTQTIYARDLKTGKVKFHNYLIKESALGLLLGIIFSAFSSFIIIVWFADRLLAASVGLSILIAVTAAPVMALCITQITNLLKTDPAAGAGPIATVVQDMLSLIIYGLISSWIIL